MIIAQECEKVAIHELTHAHIRPDRPTRQEEDMIRAHFGMASDCPLIPVEAIVELHAVAICVAFILALTGSEKYARKLWKLETRWAHRQARRVLANWRGEQKTAVLEYIVLRGALMDETFESVRETSALALTLKALDRVSFFSPEEVNEGESLRFTRKLPEELDEAVTRFLN